LSGLRGGAIKIGITSIGTEVKEGSPAASQRLMDRDGIPVNAKLLIGR
jgi:hypothetical protein